MPVPVPVVPASDPGGEPAGSARADERLAWAAGEGDLDAFNVLVLRHERDLFDLCLRLLRDVPVAEEAVRAAFVAAWGEIAAYRGQRVRPWLFRLAIERCADGGRSGPRRPVAPLDAEPSVIEPVPAAGGAESAEATALRAELGFLLERAVAALPEEQRLVVLLADVQGCDDAEIAAVTGAARGTVVSRRGRGRARVRQALGDDPAGAIPFARFAALVRRVEGDDGVETDAADAEQGGHEGAGPRTPPAPAQHLDLDALTAYLDGAMDEGDRRAAAGHLTGCLDCRRELADLGAAVDLLRGLPRYAPRRSCRLGAEDVLPLPGGRLARLLPAGSARAVGDRGRRRSAHLRPRRRSAVENG